MNRAAFIRDNGLINHSFLPDNQNTYTAGQVVDGLTVQFFPYSEDPANWHDTKFWDFTEQEWATLPENPNSPYHQWDSSQKAYVLDTDALVASIRSTRNSLLAKSDWALVADSPLTDAEQTEVRTYRTALRDLPANLDMTTISSLDDVTWPTKPSCLG